MLRVHFCRKSAWTMCKIISFGFLMGQIGGIDVPWLDLNAHWEDTVRQVTWARKPLLGIIRRTAKSFCAATSDMYTSGFVFLSCVLFGAVFISPTRRPGSGSLPGNQKHTPTLPRIEPSPFEQEFPYEQESAIETATVEEALKTAACWAAGRALASQLHYGAVDLFTFTSPDLVINHNTFQSQWFTCIGAYNVSGT